MKRRTFIAGMGTASIGGSGIIVSGAFSGGETQRRVNIEVVGDDEAYVRLKYVDIEVETCFESETIQLVEVTNQLKHDILIDSVEVWSDHPEIDLGQVHFPEQVAIGEIVDIELDVECESPGIDSGLVYFTINAIGDGAFSIQERSIELTCLCPESGETAWAYGGDKSHGIADDPKDEPLRGLDGIEPSKWGWFVTRTFEDGDIVETDLFIGAGDNNLDAGEHVGQVLFERNGPDLHVDYELESTDVGEPANMLVKSHIYVDDDTKGLIDSNAAPGQFTFQQVGTGSDTYTIDLVANDLDPDQEIVLAAHAEVAEN